ncbi:MAG: DUF4358 domain-containing protein [Oscillospiraceae bacterium]|nr:DUF4358 domain-containing protein [Oscillospiraceae bacterium]
MYARNAFFEIARWVAAFAILLSLGTLFGSNKISDADPAEVEAAVIAQLDMTSMLKADNQMVKRLYGLDPASFESCILYYPNTNMMAEEVLILKLKDTSQQEAVRTAIEARVETQKTTFDGYGVEQYALLTENCIIDIRGNYVLFVVNADCAKARDAFADAL